LFICASGKWGHGGTGALGSAERHDIAITNQPSKSWEGIDFIDFSLLETPLFLSKNVTFGNKTP
jgi:hypothetical protein